jgi:ribosomal protein S18 acetylase RimI-like enzyme
LADGFDCAYIAEVAVHPHHQGRGLGTAVIGQLVALPRGHKFLRINKATAIWRNPARAVESGLLSARL